MELGKQIKKHRTLAGLSQQEFAERVYVSRQTVSNWENDKSYPDINSLLLISDLFQLSLDQLIKGDLERMKREIDDRERTAFQRDSTLFAILFAAVLILPIPLAHFWGRLGILLYFILVGAGIYYANRVERYKRKYDIQTYREILAFIEGDCLDTLTSAREEGKRPYQKSLLVLGSVLLALAITFLMIRLLGPR